MIDLPAAPALHCFRIKPADPDENVDGAHKTPGGKRRFRRPGDAISEWNPILPAHSVLEFAVPCGTRAMSSAQR
ncbi:hypothetical protein GCM10007857_70820 [Bradyrhizobium iriomotense]|uniref:Uncharacterized protein n=1 Tax=Bradyrhizobium iriomotense TaxID=441950 RepID=A0ABQ6B7H3_9BRAD|nr:hypothetical protein GCM10007857_70820 [Bradyrhizobium iriomotense]